VVEDVEDTRVQCRLAVTTDALVIPTEASSRAGLTMTGNRKPKPAKSRSSDTRDPCGTGMPRAARTSFTFSLRSARDRANGPEPV
jgi:hypothetical protein